ncbi:uncharacterized protein EV420DRAFT_1277131 [Desarmillaria tabescens]|uniref:Uncharacterized protein n=1 Tax=Armillaria tabescens TaxID=1929756 RepID=A0AA39JLP3_ARMTA|nr:uncharacterized protein EV420DRAFT_1277131 [Desarmillaria tabescens]KAK0445056.1 hypothetical protein EV420DRAFT_1277131 [Desarmillaria tabescens]
MRVNGLKVLALWDTGSTSMAMSPNCADISKAIIFNLTSPMTLQLGTIGSRSKINFGTNSKVEMPGYMGPEYFDIVNINRYKVLIGTLFMHHHNVILDFNKKCIQVNRHDIPAIVIMGEGMGKDMNRY